MTVAAELNTQTQDINKKYRDGDMATLPCSALVAAPWGNFRKSRSSEGKASLVSSVQEQGIIQPIVVRPKAGTSGELEVLAGYGRWEACQELSVKYIPCIIRVCDDKTAMAIMLAENSERESMSPVDEAVSADVILSECKGDEKEAAAMLGWTVFKLRQRMRLMRCPVEIREMLGVKQANGFTLTLGHADELAAFPFDVQQKLVVAIVQEKWRPEDLRERAQKGSRILGRACFDKAECGQCQFNSDQQASLFAAPSAQAVCSNSSCYNKKTKAHLEQKKTELEDKYGKVLLWGAVNETHRRPLLEHAIGTKQYNDGCMSCQNRVAVLDDRPSKEGQVHENQCVDLTCYRQRVGDFKAASNPVSAVAEQTKMGASSAPVEVAVSTQVHANPQQATQAPPAPTNKPVTVELPHRIKQDNDEVMRAAAADVLMDGEVFIRASMLACLCHTSGYNNSELGLSGTLEKKLAAAMDLSVEQTNEETANAIEHLARKSDIYGSEMVQVIKRLGATQSMDKLKSATITNWEMTEERLALFTKDMQVRMLEDSGFTAAYIAANDQAKYTALVNMKTIDRQKAILAFQFDWSHWAPAHLLDSWVS